MNDLKIIFISFIGDLKNSTYGFVRKDIDKVAALNSIDGVKCLGVTFAEEIENDYYYNSNHLVKKLPKIPTRKFFSDLYINKHLYQQLDLFLEKQKFDIAIFRYNIASCSLHRLAKKYKKKFLFEHNTFEYFEHSLYINQRMKLLKFSLKPGYFFYYFSGKIWPLFCEKYFGPQIRLNAKAGISVTNEIAKYESNYAPGYYNTVITNGVNYDQNLIHKPEPYNKKQLKLFILVGTGGASPGVDRIINGLNNYKGNVNILIDVIGYYYQSDLDSAMRSGLGQKIRFLEPLSGEALNKQLNQYHLSIGSLAFHRKNLKEATPLKVRESLMRGFPTIIAYTDTDFMEPSAINDFILQLPADDTPIDFNAVVNFANKVLFVKDYPLLISSLAKPKIDFEEKAKQTIKFINNLDAIKA